MKSFYLVIFMGALLFGCGSNSGKKSKKSNLPGTLEMNKSTPVDVENELGVPESSYGSNDDLKYVYNQKTVKFVEDQLKGYYREPEKDEIHLQYWLQKWKDQKTLVSSMPETKDNHGHVDYQMNNDQERTTIIYDKDSGMVKRVMFYGK